MGINHENYNIKTSIDYNSEDRKNLPTINVSHRSTHAEEMALQKLKPNKKKKKINVSMLVIRISHKSNCDLYKLSNSKPCVSCLYYIQNCEISGYKVNKLYYSNENGEIIFCKVKDLIKNNHTVSKFYRKSNMPSWLK